MKLSIQNKIATGLLIAAIASSAALFAQETKQEPAQKKSKVHISITTEENGKSKTIDTTFNGDDEEAMQSFFRENGIESEIPPVPPIPPMPPMPLGSATWPTPPTPPAFAFDDHDFAFSMNDSEMTELSKKMEEISEKMSKASEKFSKEFEEKFGKDFEEKMKVYEEKMKDYELQMENHYKDMQKKEPAKKNKTMKKMQWIDDKDKDNKNLKHVFFISPKSADDNNNFYSCRIVLGDDSADGYTYNYKTNGDVDYAPLTSGSQVMVFNDGNTQRNKTRKIIRKIVINKTGEEIDNELNKTEETATENNALPAKELKTQNDNYNSYALDAKNLSFSPNPNEGKFNLSFSVPSNGKLEVAILNLSGQKVFDDVIENFTGEYNREIDISNHSKGTYLLQIRQGDQWLHKKFVVK